MLIDPLPAFASHTPIGIFDPVSEIYGGMIFQNVAPRIAKLWHGIVLQRGDDKETKKHNASPCEY